MADGLTPRARRIVTAARGVLESEGADAVTMRRVADELGVRAASLYKHLPDKAALEAAIISDGFAEAAAALEAAVDGAAEPLTAFVDDYRSFVAAHPHVYRLMTERPLPRELLPPGLEARTAAPLVRAVGSPERPRAAWAFIHGMITLELNGRFPTDGVTEAAWRSGIAAFADGHPPVRHGDGPSRTAPGGRPTSHRPAARIGSEPLSGTDARGGAG